MDILVIITTCLPVFNLLWSKNSQPTVTSRDAELMTDELGKKVMKPMKCRYLTNPRRAAKRTFYSSKRAIILTSIHESEPSRKGCLITSVRLAALV